MPTDAPSSSYSSSLGTVGLDPSMLAAATAILVAASVGTWRVVVPKLRSSDQLALADRRRAHQNSPGDASGPSDKKKRQRERKKRAAAKGIVPSGSGDASAKKFVVRQPSAQRHRTPVAERPSTLDDEDDGVSIPDDTPRPAEAEQNALRLGIEIVPENIKLPPSPEPGRKRAISRHSRSPSPSPSPSASTSVSTSGTPLTPPSLAASQLSLPPMAAAWDCSWSTTTTNTKNSPRRGRSPRSNAEDSGMSFPTLNPLPPPNTPLEVQVEFMRNQLDSFKIREQASRAREEALLGDLDRLRMDAESSQQEAAKLQWQLNEMAQREERLHSQLSALMVQFQTMHGHPPMPLYSQPPTMPYHYPPYYLPHPPYSPLIPPHTPSSAMSPTHAPSPHQAYPSMNVLPAPSWRGSGDATDVSPGLMEAILKRPESYGRGSPSLSGSANSRSASALGNVGEEGPRSEGAASGEESFEEVSHPGIDMDGDIINEGSEGADEKTPEQPTLSEPTVVLGPSSGEKIPEVEHSLDGEVPVFY